MENKHDIRPWGGYFVLYDGPDCKVKNIVKGELTIVLDDEKVFRKYGESIRIPKGSRHRAWNETDEQVEFIEVQTGTYFGEDDIIRIEDDYNRQDNG